MANISQIQLPSGVTYNIKDDVSGYITGMTILSYGSSTWQNFIDAYNANKVVYCRASSNSNPASGSQTRLAFMAYVNNATTPTEVEFQYYRSVSSHSASQQGDQVYVYKLNKSTGWSVIVREAMSKIAAGGDLTSSYANGTITISGNIPTVPTNVSAFTNDAGYITTDANVTQTATSIDSNDYEVLFSGTADNTTRTEGARKCSGVKINPSNGLLSVNGLNTIGDIAFIDTPYMGILDYNALTDDQEWLFPNDSGTLALTSDIPTVPTNVSAFTNDAGYLTTETDPTVPSWAKESSKPNYTFSELTTHPTSISGYGITDAYTKTEVDSKVSAVLKYRGVKATIADLPSSGNVVGDTWHVTATSGEYAWDGTEWQELGTAISIPANTGSSTTGITIANHSTDSIYGVSSSTTSVYGVSTSTTTASKVTVGSHSTDYGVTAAGSGSASLTFAMDTTDTKKLVISFSHTHTAPTLGSKVPTVSASDVTVPIKNADATTVPIKNVSATTVVTSATHSVTDNGHTHTI